MKAGKLNIVRFIVLVFMLLAAVSCKKHKFPKSSAKEITSFVFWAIDNSTEINENIPGDIINDTIFVKINQGINVGNFIPTIEYMGVAMSPANETAQNFNNAVYYTVTAEDGSTRRYVVKIVIQKANQKVYTASADGSVYAINVKKGTELWKYTTGGAIHSSPLLVGNTLYIGSMDKNLYALDATTGALKWKYLTAAPIRQESPVISNGVVFISSANSYPDGTVYAIDAVSGTLKWSKTIVAPTSPVVAGGKVFVNSKGASFYALNETDGNVVWSTIFGLMSGHAAVVNDKLYIETSGSGSSYQLRCINANNGSIFWNAPCLSYVTSPTIDNGVAYVSTSVTIPQYVEAINSTDGSFKWRYTHIHSGDINTPVTSCPFALDNLVFPGYHHGSFVALRTTNGTEAWQFSPAQGAGWFSNPVAANNMVYVGSSDNYLYALDMTGKMVWKFQTNGPIYSGACLIDYDNNIVHAGSSGAKN